MVVSLMVKVMVRPPDLALVRGCAGLPGARRDTGTGRAASRGAGRRRSRTRAGPASGRGRAGRTVPLSRESRRLDAARGPGTRSLAGLGVGCGIGLMRGEAGAVGFGLGPVS